MLTSYKDVPFVPDGWQFDLLELIDQERSALVVVPTSGGKSFVSFYAISKALQRIESEKLSIGQVGLYSRDRSVS